MSITVTALTMMASAPKAVMSALWQSESMDRHSYILVLRVVAHLERTPSHSLVQRLDGMLYLCGGQGKQTSWKPTALGARTSVGRQYLGILVSYLISMSTR